MQTYMLVNFTDQGMRNIKDTIKRAHAFEEMAKKSGAVLKVLCWTMGRYDVIAVFEAPDDESATAHLQHWRARQHPRRDAAGVFIRGNEWNPRPDGLTPEGSR
jgi:uncharacterized protein with GYD domain